MLPHHAPRCVPPVSVTLRDVRQTDLPSLFAFESDPAWCAMAMVKPRSKEVFDAVWEKILTDRTEGTTPPGVLQQAIIADGELCGTIGCHLRDGRCNVGYGLHQKHWGRGIASRALPLLLAEVALRPLYATAAVSNAASI
ncbi:MAG TPA: GNAT family N-acetyltransferase, partial [Phycisphaerales bacterium]|nr:GNAT family N-acetyltransferase [Phycisphaerales bacterium]